MAEIEVVISDARMSLTSMFGHVAITVDWLAYTMGPHGYRTLHHSDYINRQRKLRDSIGYFFRVNNEEKKKIKDELEKRVRENKPYLFTFNDCTTNVVQVLGMVGIIANDPRWFGIVPSPVDLARVLRRSNRFIRAKNYSKYDENNKTTDEVKS